MTEVWLQKEGSRKKVSSVKNESYYNYDLQKYI